MAALWRSPNCNIPIRRSAAWCTPGEAQPLARLYRIGAWYDTENFADQRFDNTGLSLANPASTGIPRNHRGDYSIYAVADQMVWRIRSGPNRTMSVFGRVMGTPQDDRNLIDFSMNAGLVFHDPFTYRTDDTFGLGMGYAHVSSRAAALDQGYRPAIPAAFTPVRSGETFSKRPINIRSRPGAAPAGYSICLQSRRRHRQPECADRGVKNEMVLGMRTDDPVLRWTR